jgi:hypothetical protein
MCRRSNIFSPFYLQELMSMKSPSFFVWLRLPISCNRAAQRNQTSSVLNIVYDFQRMIKLFLWVWPSISSTWFKAVSSGKMISKGLFCTAIKSCRWFVSYRILFSSSTIRSPEMILMRSAF